MNKTIHMFWIGGSLDEISWLSISSFIKHGFTVNLWSYHPVLKKVPYGTILRDASDILPENVIFQHRNGSWAPFSDWFRFTLLYKEGGVWADTDVVCLQPFDIPENVFCGEKEGGISIGFIALKKGHPLAKSMMSANRDPRSAPTFGHCVRDIVYDIISDFSVEEARRRAPWSYAGNDLIVHLAKDYKIPYLKSEDIYPIKFKEYKTIIDGTATLDTIKDAKCIHLWGTHLRHSLHNCVEHCLYNQLKQIILN